MLFFTLSDTNIRFAKKKLVWKTCSTADTTWRIEIINKKKFTVVALNKDETFVVTYDSH